MRSRRSWLVVVSLVVATLAPQLVFASTTATVPTGFTQTVVTDDLTQPTAFAMAPDGRIFVSEKRGTLRVIENGTLLPTPFVDLTSNTASTGERGLLGIAFDPQFNTTHWVYVYYTASTPTIHNRVSRFVADGNVAVPGSEDVVFELPALSATNHNGGAIHFGPDKRLYIAVGDNAKRDPAQSLNSLFGKILRINKSGSIPSDNPFYTQTTGKNRAIWALGLRNPFTFAFKPGTSTMFINDVGQVTWEEINNGVAGGNYGWPNAEGPTDEPGYISPLWYYGHGSSSTEGCAITGGTFYNPATVQFPSRFVGDYFYADFCSGWIRRFEPSAQRSVLFAYGISNPVDLMVAPDGSLYYLSRSAGSTSRVVKITYSAP